MSVATRNPFALLDADDRSSSPAPAPKKDSSAATTPAAASAGAKKPAGRTGGPASRGGKYYARGGGARGGSPRDTPATTGDDTTGVVAEPRKFEGRGRGRGRGGRGGGRGGGGGGDRNDRRAYDRHSQTGKTDSDKKVHQSWGGDDGIAELKNEQAADADVAVDSAAADAWGAPGDTTADAWATPEGGAATEGADGAAAGGGGGDGRPPRREREPEEEDNTLTLEQYLAQKKDLEIIPKLETRQVEGEDKWGKDVVPLAQKTEDEDVYFIGKGKSAPKPRAKKEEKIFLDIEPRFADSGRGTRGRGRGGDRGGGFRGGRGEGRGEGRGRGGRGGRGGYHGGANAVNVDDETAFPSLS